MVLGWVETWLEVETRKLSGIFGRYYEVSLPYPKAERTNIATFQMNLWRMLMRRWFKKWADFPFLFSSSQSVDESERATYGASTARLGPMLAAKVRLHACSLLVRNLPGSRRTIHDDDARHVRMCHSRCASVRVQFT